MKSLALSVILGLCATLSHAAPSPAPLQARQETDLGLTFYGAAGAFYQIEVDLLTPENFFNFNITNPLSVSSIDLGGPGFCIIAGIDGSLTLVEGGNSVDVGPPQTQIAGACSTF